MCMEPHREARKAIGPAEFLQYLPAFLIAVEIVHQLDKVHLSESRHGRSPYAQE